MWTSVPQIVVVVTRMTASPAPASGPRDLLDADVARAVEDGRPHGARVLDVRSAGFGKGHDGPPYQSLAGETGLVGRATWLPDSRHRASGRLIDLEPNVILDRDPQTARLGGRRTEGPFV